MDLTLKELLRLYNISSAELASQLEVSSSAVRAWTTKRNKIPWNTTWSIVLIFETNLAFNIDGPIFTI